MQTRIRGRTDPRADSLQSALGLLVAVWSALALGGAVATGVGRDPALLGSFALAAALCCVDHATSARASTPRRRGGSPRSTALARERRPFWRARSLGGGAARRVGDLRRVARFCALALLGVALAPILGVLIEGVGGSIGMPPRPPPISPPSAIRVFCTLVLAPGFEEQLYRGRLLPALARRFGPFVAVPISSAAFALPHLTPWSMLGSAITGVLLGAWMLRTGRTADCMALHAGLNAAGLVHDGALHGAGLPTAIAAFIEIVSHCVH